MPNQEITPIIALIADNLMYSIRIRNSVKMLGYRVELIESNNLIDQNSGTSFKHQIAEHVGGPGFWLFDKLTKLQPALIIIDLGIENIQWGLWVSSLKSAPATQRIPLIGFCSHTHIDKIKMAKKAGADKVFSRSFFINDIHSIIQKFAIQYNKDQDFEPFCQSELSPQAYKGIVKFNEGDFFEAHELLEEAWMAESGPGRELYRAILQIAVAYYQIQVENFEGAIKMFLRVRKWIDKLPDTCRGVNIQKLRKDSNRVFDVVQCLGKTGLNEFDFELLQPVEYSISK